MKARTQENKPKDQPKFTSHIARLVGLVDYGLRPEFVWQGKTIEPEYNYELTYELVNSLMEDGRPHHISEMVPNKITKNPSGDKMSNLTRRLKAMNGDADNIETMLGRPCMVNLIENPNGNGYAKIPGATGVTAAPEGMPVKELVNDTFVFDLDKPNISTFLDFPDFKQTRIKENLEFEGSLLQSELDRVS